MTPEEIHHAYALAKLLLGEQAAWKEAYAEATQALRTERHALGRRQEGYGFYLCAKAKAAEKTGIEEEPDTRLMTHCETFARALVALAERTEETR